MTAAVCAFVHMTTCMHAGEIGKLGSETVLHGFTCVVGVLRPTAEAMTAAAAAEAAGTSS